MAGMFTQEKQTKDLCGREKPALWRITPWKGQGGRGAGAIPREAACALCDPPATSQARGTAAGTGAGVALREPFLSTSESRGHSLTAGYLWAPRAQQDRGSLCSAFPGICLYGNLPSCATGHPPSPCHRTSHGSSSDRTYHPNRKEGAEIWLLAPGQHHPLCTDRNLPK